MVRITFETPDGISMDLDVDAKGSLMEAARANEVPGILADCGGSMACGTCHVVIDLVWHSKLPVQSANEREMLEYVPEPQPNTRLTCQIPVTEALNGIVMRIPKRQR